MRGWRASFVALGAAGLLVALAWAAVYRTPRQASDVTPRIAGPAIWLALLRQRSTWGLVLGFAGTVYVTWLYVTWLPGYLAGRWAMAPDAAALWSSAPQFAGFVGAVGGGWLADRLARRLGEQAARPAPSRGGGCWPPPLGSAGAAMAGNAGLALGSIAAALFCANLATTAGWALAASLAPATLIATVEAMANIGGSVGGSLAPLLTGVVAQVTGSFDPALWLAAGLATICAAAAWALADTPIQTARTGSGSPA